MQPKGKAKVSKEGANSCKFCGKAHSKPNDCKVLNRAVREALRDQATGDAMDVDATPAASGNKASGGAKTLRVVAKKADLAAAIQAKLTGSANRAHA
ncbi:hypothetical protein HDU96_006149, partial [Phlyctochytrium bullatum]